MAEKFLKYGPGAFFAAFGLLLYFVIIPYDTEVVDYGWLRPQTLPNALALILVIAGVHLLFRPTEFASINPRRFVRATFFLALIALCVYLIGAFGFLYVAPVFALVLMLFIGERRPGWLIGGVAGTPAIIWFGVEILLQRPLPG